MSAMQDYMAEWRKRQNGYSRKWREANREKYRAVSRESKRRQRTGAPGTEAYVCNELKSMWKLYGWAVIRNQQNIGSEKGIADYTVIKNGVVIFVEVKGERGTMSEHQMDFADKVESAGGNYVCVQSWGEFETYARGV